MYIVGYFFKNPITDLNYIHNIFLAMLELLVRVICRDVTQKDLPGNWIRHV